MIPSAKLVSTGINVAKFLQTTPAGQKQTQKFGLTPAKKVSTKPAPVKKAAPVAKKPVPLPKPPKPAPKPKVTAPKVPQTVASIPSTYYEAFGKKWNKTAVHWGAGLLTAAISGGIAYRIVK